MNPGTVATSEAPPEAALESPSRVFRRASLYFLLAVLPLTITWSLTNPMFASPDEPVHLIRSQGVVRGDLTSPYTTDGIAGGVCFAMDATITADCQNLAWDANRTTAADNADGYPPMFHFVAGIPNLFVSGLGGAYLTRIWLALICSSLLALAGGLLWTWRPSPWTITGFLLGCTPMVIFMISTVNPSGLTTALASVMWVSGIVIVAPSNSAPISAAYPMLLGSASLFPMLRRDAVFFQIAIFVVLWSLTRRADWPALLRQRWLQATAVGFMISATLTLVLWSGSAADSFAAGADSSGDSGRFAGLGDLGYYMLSVMGWFGWLDSPMTNDTYLIATVVLGSSIVLAIAGSSGRQARAIVVCLVTVLAIPVAVGMVRHPYFQGRYLLPLTVGLFILVGVGLTEVQVTTRFSSRLILILLSLWASVHFFAFAQNLRRYATGWRGSWNLIRDAVWTPPVYGNAVALALGIGSIAGVAVAMWRLNNMGRSLRVPDRRVAGVVPEDPTNTDHNRPSMGSRV